MTKHLNLNLQESFEYQGLWWLPEDSDKEIGGTISYSALEGVHLALLGTFDPVFPPGKSSHFKVMVVNGITTNNISCTLFNNVQVGFSWNSPGFSQQKLSSSLLVMGRHFSSFDELRFAKWRVSYENLDDWVAPSLFGSEYGTGTDDTLTVTVVAKPEDYFNEYVNAIEGRIVLTADMHSGSGRSSGQIDLSKEAFFELVPDTKQSYGQFKSWHDDIQSLLSLLMVDAIQPRKIIGILSDNEEDQFSERIGIAIFPLLKYRHVKRITKWYQMLLTFEDIKGLLVTGLERWLEAEFNVRQAIKLYFSDSNPQVNDIDTPFVNIMHALESYHRSMSEGHYISVEDYQPFLEEMIKAIPASVDRDHRQSLKSRLKFGYQYSQRKRFQELLASISVDLQQLITNDPKPFINEVVDTRNYLVHRDDSSKGLTLKWPDKVFAYHRLRMLMTILFLKYIGLDDDTIHQHVSGNHRVKQFVGSLEEEE